MTASFDPFDVLGVPETVDEDGIRTAYRKASKAAHPDTGGSRERFAEVREAYERLMDPTRRAEALRARNAARKDPVATAFDDFFTDLEKNGRGRPVRAAPLKRRPLEHQLRISLEDAYRGGVFKVAREGGSCARCSGKGVLKSAQRHPCVRCRGNGFLREGQGFITVSIECAACKGTGTSHIVECPSCAGNGGGEGFTLDVTLPAGCRDGYRLRKEGVEWLEIVVKVERHPVFTRDIENLATELPIEIWDAALGAEKTLKGIDGRQLGVKVPPGTRDGDRIFIEGAGMPAFSGRGDLLVVFRLKVPDADGPLRGLLLEMRRLGS